MQKVHTRYETIVFDLDGTLLDTLDDLTAATNAALAQFSLPSRTKNEVRAFVGNGIVRLLERAVGNSDFPKFAELVAFFKEYYKAHCADKTCPYDGIIALLDELKQRGIKTAVLSNKADFAVKQLAREYFDGYFVEAIGENEEQGIRKKPAPDSLFAVIERMGANKQTTAYVGDSEVDIQTAQNAGVDCICVTWGFRDRAVLEECGGVAFVDSPMEILDFCKE